MNYKLKYCNESFAGLLAGEKKFASYTLWRDSDCQIVTREECYQLIGRGMLDPLADWQQLYPIYNGNIICRVEYANKYSATWDEISTAIEFFIAGWKAGSTVRDETCKKFMVLGQEQTIAEIAAHRHNKKYKKYVQGLLKKRP